jgi:pyruvate/2-oxoglutarate/acetoin dehydrogenase E1 component
MERVLQYTEAILEATDELMDADPRVLVFGLGVDDPKAILGTTAGLLKKYGPVRVFDTPLSEDAMTGVAIGMAMAGLRPIHVHIRMDFLMLAMNQLVNMAAKMRYMHGAQESVPMTIRAMIGKSWGQGAQHSQALHSFFMHVPGIKVVAPTTPYDAKGCLVSAVRDENPVLYVEQRFLHFQKGPVPEGLYEVAPGRARVVAHGTDITIVGISYMQLESFRAKHYLDDAGVSAEVIDPIWLSPLDIDTIVASVRKTGRLLVVDNAWMTCGASAEIVAAVTERLLGERDFFSRPGATASLGRGPSLRLRVRRMGFAQTTCPPAPTLEDAFYPNALTIAAAAREMVTGETGWTPEERGDLKAIEFKGPF